MDLSLDRDEFMATFLQEAAENTANLEASLLSLDSNQRDPEQVNAAFRAAHSLKGSAALFGLTEITRFTHALECVLDELRLGTVSWTREIADLLLASVDIVRELLEPDAGPLSAEGERIRERLLAHGTLGHGTSAASDDARESEEAAPPPALSPRFTVRFHPVPQVLARGMDPMVILRELASVATILESVADTQNLPPLASMDPTLSYFGWDFVVECDGGAAALHEVFEFVEGFADISIEPIPSVLEHVVTAAPAIAPAAAAVAPSSDPATPSAKKNASSAETSTVRIATSKLDRILDLVGEVVIAKAMVGQALRGHEASVEIREALSTLERHTRELQEGVMAVRMVPISTIFGRFHRVVRELGGKLGKEVELVIEGGDTEIDKAMVEQIIDPLTHLVRNAIDHGVETPAERASTGKSSSGTLKLSATQRGGTIQIEIVDDGRGLALDRVKRKAIERGLLAADAEPTNEQLHMLVFEPGFSTAEQVSDVSGRGVGMDVVKRNVESLGGSLFFTSQPGEGSLIRIQLPLTMAIIDGLLLRVGASTFVVPLLSVVESFRPTQAQLSTLLGHGRILQFRGSPIPLIALGNTLSVADACDDPTRGIVVVVEAAGEVVGLLVDDLVADAQVVVKSLEANYRRVEGLSGAAVMGDGRIALILDTGALVRRSRARVEPRHASAGRDLGHPGVAA